jgi:hypothetical protein
MADQTITSDEAGEAVFGPSLDYEEMAAVLAAMGDPPPEMVGAVFRMTKGLTLKAQTLADIGRSVRELNPSKLTAAIELRDEANVIIQSADFSDCPSWR